jgi:leucyl aminopeptidase
VNVARLSVWRGAAARPLDGLYLLAGEGRPALDGLALPGAPRRALARELERVGFAGRDGELLAAASPTPAFRRVVALGVGRPGELTLAGLRRALRRLLEQAARQGDRAIAVAVAVEPADLEGARPREVTLVELALADYRFDRFRTSGRNVTTLSRVHVVPLRGEGTARLAALVRRAEGTAARVRLARDLGNRPGNDLTPARFAREIRSLFRGSRVRVTVMGRRQLERAGLAGVLAVGAGSAHAPCLVALEHRPARSRATVVLVGKGVTFDAGGISLKPPADMASMKHDMAGAAAVVAAMRGVAERRPPLRILALLPLVENLPSGSAMRPGDILRLHSGVTVEVDDTDAEGRIVLADALAWAARFRPDVVVDVATLTGACRIALGHELAGLFCNDDDLAARLERLARATGEGLWRLPLRLGYRELLKSEFADLKNTGGRWGSLPASASFLERFVPAGVRWAHLDIAGVGHVGRGVNGLQPGATGFGVRLLEALLDELAEER